MWEQLKFYLQVQNKSSKLHAASSENIGKTVEILKRIKFFWEHQKIYGADILQYYIPMLQCYELQSERDLIDFDGVFYVVVEGILKGIHYKVNQHSKQQEYDFYEDDGKIDHVCDGGTIDNSSKTYRSVKTQTDCKLLKIFRYHSRYSKQNIKLSFMEKQRGTKSRELMRIIQNKNEKTEIKEKLGNLKLFDNLSDYDLNEIVVESTLVKYPKAYKTHHIAQEINKIGVIISGNIKLTFVAAQTQSSNPGKQVLKKYLIHQHKLDSLENANITTHMTVDDCLGLQQYLWHENSLSKGEVISVEAEIVYIPGKVFGRKFNETVNYDKFTRIKGLIESKKFLINKTLTAKQEKQEETRLSFAKAKKFKQILQSNSAKSTKLSLRNRNLYDVSELIPQTITHRIFQDRKNEGKYASIPKNNQRVNFFPQLFENSAVPIEFKEKLKRAKEVYEKQNIVSQRKQSHYKQPSLSPERINQKLLFRNLQKNEKQKKRGKQRHQSQLENYESKRKLSNRSSLTITVQNTGTLDSSSSNFPQIQKRSIYNNFGICKQKSSRYQTLEIL